MKINMLSLVQGADKRPSVLETVTEHSWKTEHGLPTLKLFTKLTIDVIV